MISIDTSSLIAFFGGRSGADVDAVGTVLHDGVAILTPPVVAEFLSDPSLPKELELAILDFPRVQLEPDFWLRTARLRRKLLAKNLRARLADSLIAQCCIDHQLTLITRDKDFQTIEEHSNLRTIGLD